MRQGLGLVIGLVAMGQIAAIEESGSSELLRRLDAIDSRLEALSRSSEERWLDDRRSSEIRDLVNSTLEDADARASLAGSGMTGGYDNGFFLASADGNFRLNFSGQIQTRYVFNHQNASPTDDSTGGFEVRRMRLKADGYVVDPSLKYTVGVQFGPNGDFRMLDEWIGYEVTKHLQVTLGRFRLPFLREQEVSSRKQLLVDRSLVSKAFGEPREAGVQVDYEQNKIRLSGALTDDNSNYFAGFNRWRAAGRAELLLVGKWKHVGDFTNWPDEKPIVVVGVGLRYEEKDKFGPTKHDTQVPGWTADISAKLDGVSLFAAVAGKYPDKEGSPTLHQYGAVVQASVRVGPVWELAARYEWGDADDNNSDLSIVTVGVNRYFYEHTLKWTTDAGYAFNSVSTFWASDSAGWRVDTPGESGQIVLRTQFQLLF